jgi:hypothetical protein
LGEGDEGSEKWEWEWEWEYEFGIEFVPECCEREW